MSEEMEKKVNEALSEEDAENVAGGVQVLLGRMGSCRCQRCGKNFEVDLRKLEGRYICPACGALVRADQRML